MFIKTAAVLHAERTTLDDWKQNIVSASVRDNPAVKEVLAEFDLDREGFVYVRTRAVSCFEMHGLNQNGDGFEAAELEKNHSTFRRRGAYLNHESDDPEKAIGIILDATWHPKQGFVQTLIAIDRNEPIAAKIEKGIANRWSMGALVKYCVCTVCDKKAESEADYCDHLANYMGREYNGKKVGALNRDVSFYEESNVTIPADPNAETLQVIAGKKGRMAQYLALAESYTQQIEEMKRKAEKIVADEAIVSDIRGKLNNSSSDNQNQILGAVRHKLRITKAKASELQPREGDDAVHHRVQAALEAEGSGSETQKNQIQETNTSSLEGIKVENNLTISYLPGDTLAECYFIARKGKLQAFVKAADILEGDVQTAIVASEATGKRKVKASEPAEELKDDSKPTPDNTGFGNNFGKSFENAQPKDEANALSAKPAEELKDDTKPSPDSKHLLGQDPIQPSDVVKKYAQLLGATNVTFKMGRNGSFSAMLSNGSISRLATLWNTVPKHIREVKAKLDNSPNISREDAHGEGKELKGMPTMAREDKSKELAKPAGSTGSEQRSYYQGYNSKNLSEGGADQWARKVAELAKKASALESENKALKVENDTLKKTVDAVKHAQVEEKKAHVINAIVNYMEKVGALKVDQHMLIDLQEQGFSNQDAQVKAYKDLKANKFAELKQLDLKALETMAKNLSELAPEIRATASKKDLQLPAPGRDESPAYDEDRLAGGWD